MTFMQVSAKKTKSMLQNASKNSFFGAWFCFFCWHLHKCHFITKIGTHVEKTSKFLDKKIQIFLNFFTIFLDFTVHAGAYEPWSKEHFRKLTSFQAKV